MDESALVRSLTAQVRALEDKVVQLHHQLEQTKHQVEDAVTAEAILRRARATADSPSLPPRDEAFDRAVAQAKALHQERGRHLRVVKGTALGALGAALLHWTPKRAAIGAALTVAGIGATLSPGMLAQQAPVVTRPHSHSEWLGGTSRTVTGPAPSPGPVVPRRKCRDRDGDADAVILMTLAGRACRERDGDRDGTPRTAGRAAAPAPSPAASPFPSPTGAVPLPSTSPLPVPSPTCTMVPGVPAATSPPPAYHDRS